MQSNASVADYRLLQKRNGTTRTVIVTPAAYVTDNRITPDGIQQLGAANTRGVAVAQAYIKAAPERMVWGSDWPHPTEKDKPNDAVLFDLLGAWAPDEATRRRILVTNPEALYGFARVG